MRDNEGFEIRHNGVPRSYRDTKAAAYDAARFAKGQNRGYIIEIVDRSTGAKLIMLEDGRTGYYSGWRDGLERLDDLHGASDDRVPRTHDCCVFKCF